MKLKEVKAKFPYVGDIIAVITSFVMAGITFYTALSAVYFMPLAGFYAFIGIIRLVILLFEVRIAKMGLSVRNQFIKERRILRLTGLLLFFTNIVIFSALLVLVVKKPSDLYSQYQFAVYGYAVFATYKFISSIVFLVRARRSYSPYRETICCLSFIAALMTLLSLEVLLLALFGDGSKLVWLVFEMITAGFISIVVFILSIVMMIARRVPQELRQR